MGQQPMFSPLDAAFRSLGMDQGALLKMFTLERAGPRHMHQDGFRCQAAGRSHGTHSNSGLLEQSVGPLALSYHLSKEKKKYC